MIAQHNYLLHQLLLSKMKNRHNIFIKGNQPCVKAYHWIFGSTSGTVQENVGNFISSVLRLRRHYPHSKSRAPVFHCELTGHLPHLALHLLHQHHLRLLLMSDHLHHLLDILVLLQEGGNRADEFGGFWPISTFGGSASAAGPFAGHIFNV